MLFKTRKVSGHQHNSASEPHLRNLKPRSAALNHPNHSHLWSPRDPNCFSVHIKYIQLSPGSSPLLLSPLTHAALPRLSGSPGTVHNKEKKQGKSNSGHKHWFVTNYFTFISTFSREFYSGKRPQPGSSGSHCQTHPYSE